SGARIFQRAEVLQVAYASRGDDSHASVAYEDFHDFKVRPGTRAIPAHGGGQELLHAHPFECLRSCLDPGTLTFLPTPRDYLTILVISRHDHPVGPECTEQALECRRLSVRHCAYDDPRRASLKPVACASFCPDSSSHLD